jgi:hypothetical protein
VGNKLPHPASLFGLFAVSVVVGSGVLAAIGYVATHPSTGEPVAALSLLNGDGLRRIVTSLVSNFTSFVPLGTVLVAMLGVGVAEGSGLLSAALRAMVLAAPRRAHGRGRVQRRGLQCRLRGRLRHPDPAGRLHHPYEFESPSWGPGPEVAREMRPGDLPPRPGRPKGRVPGATPADLSCHLIATHV